MRAIILAAGRGSRLQPLTNTTPKPLLVIDGKTLLEHQLYALAAIGVRDVCINLHWLGKCIYNFLHTIQTPCNIHYQWEKPLLNTGGAIVKALDWLCQNNDSFLVLNADIHYDFPLAKLSRQCHPTLVIIKKQHAMCDNKKGDFSLTHGLLSLQQPTDYIFCGISMLTRHMFLHAPSGAFPLRTVFLHAIQTQGLYGLVHTGKWSDLGSWDTLNHYQWGIPKSIHAP